MKRSYGRCSTRPGDLAYLTHHLSQHPYKWCSTHLLTPEAHYLDENKMGSATIVLMVMSMNPFTVHTRTVTSKGQLTIPKALCQRYGIQRGDKVEIWVENGSIVFQPVKRKGQLSTPLPDSPDDLT